MSLSVWQMRCRSLRRLIPVNSKRRGATATAALVTERREREREMNVRPWREDKRNPYI